MKKNRTTIYLIGPQVLSPEDWEPFGHAHNVLTDKGFAVLGLGSLPEGISEEANADICLAMLYHSDAVLLLPGWKESLSSVLLKVYAEREDKLIYTDLSDVLALMTPSV